MRQPCDRYLFNPAERGVIRVNILGSSAAIVGFLSVALGAFGAHALADILTDQGKDWWRTATMYALPHAAAVFAIGISVSRSLVRTGGWVLLLGTVIFAGTLYSMALGAPRWLGAITPIGGTSLLIGWLICAVGARNL